MKYLCPVSKVFTAPSAKTDSKATLCNPPHSYRITSFACFNMMRIVPIRH